MIRKISSQVCRMAYTCPCKQSSAVIGGISRNIHTTQNYDSKRSREQAFEVKQDNVSRMIPEVKVNYQVDTPTLDTLSVLYDGIRFDELPIIHIKSTPNNTIVTAQDVKSNKVLFHVSCGTEGFRNVKKGTNVAAQATGLAMGSKLYRRGMKNVRVAVQGLGVGRLPAIQGLVMGGVTIVSITDTTRVDSGLHRPKKAKRI